MVTPAIFLGWLAIGTAASLAAMILPSRRGVAGVVGKILSGMLGAILGSVVGVTAFGAAPGGQECLTFAAGGALVSLALAHLGWTAWGRRRHALAAGGGAR